MGDFVTADEMRAKARAPELKMMEAGDMDDLFIYPAEARIEEGFGLDYNTDGIPVHWEARFASHPNLEIKFINDRKRSIYALVNRMAINPDGLGSQSVRGTSVGFGKKMPEEVRALMRKWGRPRRVFRV